MPLCLHTLHPPLSLYHRANSCPYLMRMIPVLFSRVLPSVHVPHLIQPFSELYTNGVILYESMQSAYKEIWDLFLLPSTACVRFIPVRGGGCTYLLTCLCRIPSCSSSSPVHPCYLLWMFALFLVFC